MPSFAVHIDKDARPGDRQAFARAVIVKDRFSIPALLFSVFWFAWHRLWLALLGVIVLYGLYFGVTNLFAVHPVAVSLGQMLLALAIALEANAIRRWTLTRRGKPMRDVVVAENMAEAEIRAAARWLDGASAAAPQPAPARSIVPAVAGRALPPDVIGLFPDPGPRR